MSGSQDFHWQLFTSALGGVAPLVSKSIPAELQRNGDVRPPELIAFGETTGPQSTWKLLPDIVTPLARRAKLSAPAFRVMTPLMARNSPLVPSLPVERMITWFTVRPEV